MRKISNRDINFALNALILALVIMAVLQSIQPLVSPPDKRIPEAREYVKELKTISPAGAVKLMQAKGKPSVILVYASWCPYCRKLMPAMVELINEKKLDGVNTVILSIDKEPFDLSNYLVHNDYKGIFTPYILDGSGSAELRGALSVLGSGFVGHIPYMGFFDKDGKLVAENLGMVDKGRLLADIEKIKPAH